MLNADPSGGPTPPSSDPGPDGQPPGAARKGRLLLVDDEPELRQLLHEVLAEQGWDVAEAEDGQRALERLSSERFAVVLLDQRMPRLTGAEVFRRMRARGDVTPVILMTAALNVHELARALGIPRFLGKPFDLDELLTTVQAAATPPDDPA